MDETLQTVLTLRKHLNKDRYEIVCELMPCVQILLKKKSVPGQGHCRGSNSVEGQESRIPYVSWIPIRASLR